MLNIVNMSLIISHDIKKIINHKVKVADIP